MKITWKPRSGASGSTIVLGDDSLGRGVGCKFVLVALPAFSQQVQVSGAVRASSAEIFGRKNVVTRYRCLVDYEFRNHGECTRFFHRLADALVEEGTLCITHDDGGQDCLDGAWLSMEPAGTGVAVQVTYEFVGGRFTKPTPASSLT